MNSFPDTHILHLSGIPQERGQVYGETMRSQIHDILERWKTFLANSIDIPPEKYIQELVTQTSYTKVIERWTPGILEEVKGIAEGANVDFTELFGFQLQDEEWWFGEERKKAQRSASIHCSAIGWLGGDEFPTLVAQNMDLPAYLDGYQVILHIRDAASGIESFIFSVAGLIALNGINNQGIGIVCNNLSQLKHSTDGLPVAFIHRGVLEQNSFASAKAFLQNIVHASGQNYLMGSPGEIIDLECSANQVVAYTQTGRKRSFCHTNHPIVNNDFMDTMHDDRQPSDQLLPVVNIVEENSRLRMESITRNSLVAEVQAVDVMTAKNILSSHESPTHPVCRHYTPERPWMTIGTSIMTLDSHPQLHVCPGPPCSSTFTIFSF